MENPYAAECLREVCAYLDIDINATHQLYPYDWFSVGFLVRHYLCTLNLQEFQAHLPWLLLRGANPLEILHTNPQGLREDFDLCLSLLMDTEDQSNFHAHREALACLSCLLQLIEEDAHHNVDMWAPDLKLRKADSPHQVMLKNAWHKDPTAWWLIPYSDQTKHP